MRAIGNGVPLSPAYERTDRATEADRLEGLADLASGRDPGSVGRTLALAWEALGMDIAFVSEFAEGRMGAWGYSYPERLSREPEPCQCSS